MPSSQMHNHQSSDLFNLESFSPKQSSWVYHTARKVNLCEYKPVFSQEFGFFIKPKTACLVAELLLKCHKLLTRTLSGFFCF